MSRKVASLSLTEFFTQEYHADPNGTLGSVRDRLRALADAQPGETASSPERLLAETEELIQQYDEHCPLDDFLGSEPASDAGPGTRG